MDNDAFQVFLTGSFQEALDFYDARAVTNKKWYRILSIYIAVASAGLTLFVSFVPTGTLWRFLSATLSASLVVATGLLSHFKFHENWLSYRASWDALRRERQFHAAGIVPYDSADTRNCLFVERVQAILSREAAEFYARHSKCESDANSRPSRVENASADQC